MTGNIALDIVIGLFFVYALYSLFATIVTEVIATNFQFRARNLGRAIRRMLDDEENSKVLAEKFFDQSLIKYMSSGWIKLFNKPSYLKARNFSQATIQSLLDKAGGNSTGFGAIKTGLDKIQDSDTGKFLLSLYNEAGNLEKFKESLELWFDDTMDRAKDWYKSLMIHITFLIGLIIATIFNVDTFQIVDKLSKDPKARQQYVEMAGKLIENPQLTEKVVDLDLRKNLMADTELRDKFGNDSAAFADFINDSVYSNTMQSRELLFERLDSLYIISNKAQSILSFKRNDTGFIYDSWMNFAGCLVTAIALSLGASFWFDLLNKIMQLRSSLIKPATTEKSDNPGGNLKP